MLHILRISWCIISLQIRSMWETICDANHIPVHIPQTVNFCPNFPESPFLELQTRKPPPPISENFRFEMTKVYSEIPPSPFWKTSDLRWPKFTPKYPPFSENFRFEMTKVYSKIPPPPSFWKTSDLRWPKFTPKYPSPISENFRFEMSKVYSKIPPLPISENPGDRMWRLICNPQGYYSFYLCRRCCHAKWCVSMEWLFNWDDDLCPLMWWMGKYFTEILCVV